MHALSNICRISAFLCVLVSSASAAELQLATLFADHMVLQRDKPVPIWGWTEPSSPVTVKFAGQSKTVHADGDGKWMLKLDPLPASSESRDLVAEGGNQITIHDVLVGEVWLGSGQSNMAMTVSAARGFEVERAASELPQIRMFREASEAADKPQERGNGAWIVCSPSTVGAFSATLLFFGRELHQELGVPIGLINSSVGGTPIESWIDATAQKKDADLKPIFVKAMEADASFDAADATQKYELALLKWKASASEAKAAGKAIPKKPRDPVELRKRKGNIGGLFNGKIHPLIPYAIRGILWYQGEANSHPTKGFYYRFQLPLLVTDWRNRWNEELPFAWVQLPNYEKAGEDWMLVREGMLQALQLPNTGMAVTIDIGDNLDIHPKNKQDVGKRLASWALNRVYHRGDKFPLGPFVERVEIRGDECFIAFNGAEKGLRIEGDSQLGFMVAGNDKAWNPAAARIDGNTVIVRSAAVGQPVAIRYAWSPSPKCILFGDGDLPASPFRTDEWEVGDTPAR